MGNKRGKFQLQEMPLKKKGGMVYGSCAQYNEFAPALYQNIVTPVQY